MRTVSCGRLTATWDFVPRRWHINGPGDIRLLSVPGRREDVLSFMRLMQGLPTDLQVLDRRGTGAALMRAALLRHHGLDCQRACCERARAQPVIRKIGRHRLEQLRLTASA